MKFSCCIEMIFTEVPFIERFRKAKESGFEYVEFWNWDTKDIAAIKNELVKNGLKLAAFQGNHKGRMINAEDQDIYFQGVVQGLEIAKELGALNIFVMSDILQEDRSVLPLDRPISEDEKRSNSIMMLKKLAPLAERAGVTLVIEPLNTYIDHRGYSLFNTKPAVEIVKEVGSPNVKLLYDMYHMQIMEGNISDNITQYHKYFGHVHIADVQGRGQPGTGELNYVHILQVLKNTGYDRIVGWEFTPVGGDSETVVKDTFKLFSSL
ncbi:MAG: hydroxypyruvate isomerase family protein [Negativicutes bacterium]